VAGSWALLVLLVLLVLLLPRAAARAAPGPSACATAPRR
jgi:hypothetical protein